MSSQEIFTIGDLRKFLDEWEQRWKESDGRHTWTDIFGEFEIQPVMVDTFREVDGKLVYTGIGHSQAKPMWELGLVIQSVDGFPHSPMSDEDKEESPSVLNDIDA